MTSWHTLRQTLARLRAEHAQVADLATVTNLQRLRWLAPTVLFVNALHALALALRAFLKGGTLFGLACWWPMWSWVW